MHTSLSLFGTGVAPTEVIVSNEEIYEVISTPFSSLLEVSDPLHHYGPYLAELYTNEGFDGIDTFLTFLSEQEGLEFPRVRYISSDKLGDFRCGFIQDGAIAWQKNHELLEAGRYIFVMTTDGHFYCGVKEKGQSPWFLHSSLGASLKVAGAGKFVVGKDGNIEKIINCSGHYCPTEQAMYQVLHQLFQHRDYDLPLIIVLLKSGPDEKEIWQPYYAADWFNSYDINLSIGEKNE